MTSNKFNFKGLLIFLGCGTIVILGAVISGAIILLPSYEALRPLIEASNKGVDISQYCHTPPN
ncbi:MAG: hypothetical protein ACRC2S_25045 [Waterburya sp.]